jgi:Cupin-like domain
MRALAELVDMDTRTDWDSPKFHASPPLINGEPGEFGSQLNKSSFAFNHNLVGHPLFEVSRLARLAETVIQAKSQSYVVCKVAESVPNVAKQWQNFSEIERVTEAITHIRESGSWVMIGGAQIDPEYDELTKAMIVELETLTGRPLREEITWVDAFIFIGSPNSVTHFHIDSETNFLFQVHGTKKAHLFDQSDRQILSEQDIERFYVGNKNAASFRPEYEDKATVYDFRPGTAIHIPVNAPHWVKNLEDYSVSYSILIYTRSFDARARVYQMNHCLRKLGMKPVAPGVSPMRDTLKSGFLKAISPRHPKTKHEVLQGGLDRVLAVERGVKRLFKSATKRRQKKS